MSVLGSLWDRAGRLPPAVSFEFFPPKTDNMAEILWSTVMRLAPLGPRFVSVTYGAGGSTRKRTHETVARLKKETALEAAAHLTCVAATRAEIDEIARGYWAAGVRHIVALRGDPPEGTDTYRPTPDGYASAADMVAGLKQVADFQISVACYPETHPEAPSPAFDLDNLKRKVDAGASHAISQFFFEPEVFLRFRDRAVAAGVDIPITPGILPVTNFATVKRFAKMCGATVPTWIGELFETLDEDPETRKLVAATIAGEQCRILGSEGVDFFHFYTLNRADLTFAICHMLGRRPCPELPA